MNSKLDLYKSSTWRLTSFICGPRSSQWQGTSLTMWVCCCCCCSLFETFPFHTDCSVHSSVCWGLEPFSVLNGFTIFCWKLIPVHWNKHMNLSALKFCFIHCMQECYCFLSHRYYFVLATDYKSSHPSMHNHKTKHLLTFSPPLSPDIL